MKRRVYEFNAAIVRTPGRSVVSGLRANGGEDPDYAGVCAEHAAYVAALEEAGIRVEVLPPLEPFPTENAVEDAARFHALIEAHVRHCPPQYLWTYKRFKRPDSGKDPYQR